VSECESGNKMASVSTDISGGALSYAYTFKKTTPEIIIMRHDFGSIHGSFQSTFFLVLCLFGLTFWFYVFFFCSFFLDFD
jgi:hypothetical protein